MKKTCKKLIAIVLALLMLGSVVPTMAFAVAEDTQEHISESKNVLESILNDIKAFIQNIINFLKSLFGLKCGDVPVEKITTDKSELKLLPEESSKITATVSPADATDKSITYASSDEAVATVDASGNVTAIAAGTATITIASAADATILTTVTVTVFNSSASTYDEIKRPTDGNHILTDDIAASNVILAGTDIDATIDLNGKTITAENKGQFLLAAQYGGVLHLTGDGIVTAGKGFYANKEEATIIVDGGTYNTDTVATLKDGTLYHSIAQNNSKIIINDGAFISKTENAALFYVANNATLEINGGYFENTEDKTPDLFHMGTNKDSTNRIIIKGGTFVNYNPLEDRMCYTGEWPDSYEKFVGPYMLIWDGYKVISEEQANGDIWYSVVPA